jgi:hypothetical protein
LKSFGSLRVGLFLFCVISFVFLNNFFILIIQFIYISIFLKYPMASFVAIQDFKMIFYIINVCLFVML